MAASTIVTTGAELRRLLGTKRAGGARVGFVPTMGALHEGHRSLVAEARRRADLVVVSIFVNPTQFGPGEDFARYPRDLERDRQSCESVGVDIVFAPSAEEMYPPGDDTRVRVGALSEQLCGPFRPGHFEGVATVVAKLFSLVGPCVAVFGKKDYQQFRIIERMGTDLHIPVTVVGHPIVREADGLAMSSRNAYLTAEQRKRAGAIPRALAQAEDAFACGERRVGALLAAVHRSVDPAASSIDYVTIGDPMTLRPHDHEHLLDAPALLALALRIGATRLIDNVVLGEDAPPRSVLGEDAPPRIVPGEDAPPRIRETVQP
jgi:pantoate--beta-alanine ligase